MKAIRDFSAEPHTEQISIQVDEVLTVTGSVVEQGWLKGKVAFKPCESSLNSLTSTSTTS